MLEYDDVHYRNNIFKCVTAGSTLRVDTVGEFAERTRQQESHQIS